MTCSNILINLGHKGDNAELLGVTQRQHFDSKIVYETWLIDEDQWLPNQHIHVLQNLMMQ